MGIISKGWVLSSAILLLVLRTAYSHDPEPPSHIKTAVFKTPMFEMAPGSVSKKIFWDIPFPKGHIAVKSFFGELVDEAGNSVPLHETYLHRAVFEKYHQRVGDPTLQHPERVMSRNSGSCQDDILGYQFVIGAEARRTATAIPDPFGIEVGNPNEVLSGYEEKWMVDVMAIDTRGVQDRIGCKECRCDLYNVNGKDAFGNPLMPGYKGGSLCCYDGVQCRLMPGFNGPKRNFYIKYTVKWIDWCTSIVPVKVYMLDVTDEVSNGKHQCKVEYGVEACNRAPGANNGCIEVKRTSFSVPTGGHVIYAVARQHGGGAGATLYGQDGRVICSSKPIYGTGQEPGNEAGYIVGMQACYPHPGSVKINCGETITVESNYSSVLGHTGAVGQFYMLVAEQLPQNPLPQPQPQPQPRPQPWPQAPPMTRFHD